MARRCIVTLWKATITFQWCCEKCWALEFLHRLLCHHFLGAGGRGYGEESSPWRGDHSTLYKSSKLSCGDLELRLAAAAAHVWYQSVLKIVKPSSSESKATSPQRRCASELVENSKNNTNLHNLLENTRRSGLDTPPLVRASSYVQPLTWENNLPLCVEHRINIHRKASHRLTVATWSPRWEFIRRYGQEKYAYEWMKETHDCAGGEDESLVIN